MRSIACVENLMPAYPRSVRGFKKSRCGLVFVRRQQSSTWLIILFTKVIQTLLASNLVTTHLRSECPGVLTYGPSLSR